MYTDEVSDNIKTYYFSGGGVSVRLKNGVAEYTHLDHQGSPTVASTSSGAQAWRESYTPFGEKFSASPANKDNVGYTGHVQDDQSGLTYMQARYYDPVAGRFLSTDPIGYSDQMNLYAYVHNDPINNIDPDGRRCVVANGWSGYCARASGYRQLDKLAAGKTHFFAAAAKTVTFLANNDLPIAGIALSSKSEKFLREVSVGLANSASKLFKLAQKINDPTIADKVLVNVEQTAVEGGLNSLSKSDRKEIVDDVNASFQFAINNEFLFSGSASDLEYIKILKDVQEDLGVNIDFGNQDHREAIGLRAVAGERNRQGVQ